MASNHALNTIHNLLNKEVTYLTEIPFGGKTIVLGGDFRQCLSILPHAMRSAIVQSSVKFSTLWNSFNKLPLEINVRSEDAEYSNWLLRLRNGELTNQCGLEEDMIETPSEMVCSDCIVKDVFGDNISVAMFKTMAKELFALP